MKTHGKMADELIETDFFSGLTFYNRKAYRWLEFKNNSIVRNLDEMEIENFIMEYLRKFDKDNISTVKDVLKAIKIKLYSNQRTKASVYND